jgi:hypothetical protein
VLREDEWRAEQRRHEQIVDEWAAPRLERRLKGLKHPVDDFLWEYYPVRPGQLRKWSPGLDVALTGAADEFLERKGFVRADDGVLVDRSVLVHQRAAAARISLLLQATSDRPARFGCFALHEWAMVYGLSQDEVRHRAWPLRVSPDDVKDIVDELGLRCTHFDAFRFYTDQARPLNPLQLTREMQVETEQPGCLHANMDLYKWTWQLFPAVSSDLVRATRELAVAVRQLDMQASPYDVRELGVEPILIHTPEGRAEFTAAQREFAARAEPLRAAVLTAAMGLLTE